MKRNESYRPEISSRSNLAITTTWWSHAGRRFTRLLFLALTVSALWLIIEDRWGSNFHFPTRYFGDSHYVLGMMKLAKEGNLGLFTHITTESLGAPFTGQLNDFPQIERMIVCLGGQMARLIGLMPAANSMLIFSFLVAAFSFYAAARLWKISRLTAWVFAVVYAFLPHYQRSLDSFGVIFTGLLPLQFYSFWHVATVQTVSLRSFRFRLAIIVGLISGLLNIYWIFFFLQMYALALLCRLLRRRHGFILALVPFVATCFTTALIWRIFVIYRASHGANPTALVRSYFDIELYALKPVELLILRWGTHLSFPSDFFSRYYDGGKIDIGEYWWGIYIGIVVLAGLFILFFNSIQRQVNKRAPSLPFLAT